MSCDPNQEAIIRGKNRTKRYLKALVACSHWRRSTTDQEASVMWWIITNINMPIATAVQKLTPTSQAIAAAGALPGKKAPTSTTKEPATPTISAFVGLPAGEDSRGRAAGAVEA